MSAGPRYARCGAVLWRRAAGWVVLLVPPSDEVFTLDGTGGDLWEAMAEPRHLDEIAGELAARYGVSPRRVALDIEATVDELVRRGAVQRIEG